MRVYHFTNRKNVANIQRHGFLERAGALNSGSFVWFTRDPNDKLAQLQGQTRLTVEIPDHLRLFIIDGSSDDAYRMAGKKPDETADDFLYRKGYHGFWMTSADHPWVGLVTDDGKCKVVDVSDAREPVMEAVSYMDMRAAINLIESAGRPTFTESADAFAFADHMVDACSLAEVGFYFEEGGCWGMALALADCFQSVGLEAQIVVANNTGRDGTIYPSHAMVRVAGQLFDHQGEAEQHEPLLPVTREQLIALAEDAGVDEEQIEQDRELAAQIIQNAIEFAEHDGTLVEGADGHSRPNSFAFRQWFRGSKAVDSHGHPLVVYHGTDADFDAFDSQKARFPDDKGAFFFTDHHGTAEGYGRVMAVYLALRNPLIINADPDLSAIETWDYSDGSIRTTADSDGHDGVIIRGQGNDESLFVAFHANQIKSVHNGGEFGGTPNIFR